ncbi:uncharacterized protein ATC70_007248 [Mucor velutinosus]|uniref:Uncharacterized protein n=1 Tax=Mucor velutinosus TaxID=708070 RepID=A0AAN7D9T9_9FUNG|nr:hypothetical protein ATC70_007248 [Mucor velutinosus]
MSNEENHELPKVGKTAKEFNILAGKYIEGSVKAALIPLVKEAFLPIIPDQTEAIEECYSQGKDYMEKQLKKHVYQIIKENDLVEKQNKLDQMLTDAKGRERVSTHLVPTPSQVSLGIVYKSKQMELLRLQKMLDDLTEENYKQMNAIRTEIKEKREKQATFDKQIKQFSKTVEYANSLPTEDLIATMEELDLKDLDS